MSAKNSIQVAIKVRPLLRKEKDQQCPWRIVENSIQLMDSQAEPYYFDHIFDQDATNPTIFDKMAKQIVHSAVKGFNGTIFAYGQTSSGKTYTMMGDDENPGVMVLAVKEIFKEIERTSDRQFLMRVGYIEIYNEKIYDLLNKEKQDLKIHETPTGIVSVNCEEIIIQCEGDMLNYLKQGCKERTVGETNMNERSSRSHAIFRIIIESRKIDRSDDAITQSVINLVDLAGSERADQTGARGTRLKEGGHINKSLLFLSNVIKRLSENEDDKYISYRDSKLTRILQASLGGNALTAIICTIKPNAVDETLSTLNFALRAKIIKNKPQVNEIVSDATMMKRYEHEVKVLKTLLEEERRKNSKIKVRQLEQRIFDESLKIISCSSLVTQRNREKRRRTWCPPSSINLDASVNAATQPSALPVPMIMGSTSRLQPPKTSYHVTSLITLRPTEPPKATTYSGLPIPPDDLPEIDEEFAPAELVNFERSPSSSTRKYHHLSITPKGAAAAKLTLEQVEHDLLELQDYTNLEKLQGVKHEPELALKQQVESLSQRNAVLENERLDYIKLKDDIEIASVNFIESQKRCDALQIQISKLTNANKIANEKIVKYETQLAEIKLTNEKLEMENREAVNLEFEFQRHKNKSKLREAELLEALNEKEIEITKLEKSLTSITAEKLQNSKEELLQLSLKKVTDGEGDGKVCIQFEDLQRLLEENKKVTLEFEKLTLEYEKLKFNYVEIEKDNEENKLKITQLEDLQQKEKAEFERLQLDVQSLRARLQGVQLDYEQLSIQNSSKQAECTALSREVELARQEMVVIEEKFNKLELSRQEQLQTLNDIKSQYANIQTKYEHLQNQYEQLETTSGQSLTDCLRLEKENVELQSDIEDLKKKVHDAQQKLLENIEQSEREQNAANDERSTETTKLQQDQHNLEQKLLEIQTQYEDLQKEYEDLSNQLMDHLQESESLKQENSKLEEKLKTFEEKNADVSNAEAQINELKSQLEKVLTCGRTSILKTPSPCRNSSMRSSGVCVEEEDEEEKEKEGNNEEDLFRKFSELSESLTEIELEHSKGKTKVFKSSSKKSSSTPNNYKLYLRNIMGVSKTQKQFDMEIENIHLQGSFKHHSFHIVELTSEDNSRSEMETECDGNYINGCDNVQDYIEKLKQEINDLRQLNDNERHSNKSLFESTERAITELKEQIQYLQSELSENQQQIVTLEKEKADMTIVYEELQERVNCTFNGSFNSLLNITANVGDIKSSLTDVENFKLREKQIIESFDSQTKMLEELTQRNIDMECELQTAKEQLKTQDKEYKEKCNQLQLEIIEKLELSANEYRDNMKKYNKEWEERRQTYEQIIQDLNKQLESFKQKQQMEEPEANVTSESLEQQAEDKEEKVNDKNQNYILIEEQNVTDEKQDQTLLEENIADENQELEIQENLSPEQQIEYLKLKKLELEEEKHTLETRLNCVEEEFENLKQESYININYLEEQLKNFKEQNLAHCEEKALLDSRLISLEEHVRDAQELHKTMCDEKAILETQVSDIEQDLNCIPLLHEQVEELTSEKEKLQLQYKSLQQKLQDAELQIQAFCIEDSNREEMQQTLQNKLRSFEILVEEKQMLIKDLESLQNECKDLRESLKNGQEKESLIKQENETLEHANSLLKEANENLSNSESKLKSENSKSQEKLQQISHEYEIFKAEHEKLEIQLKELTEEKKSVLNSGSQLELEKCKLQEKLEKLSDTTFKLELENSKLESKLQQVNHEYEKLDLHLKELFIEKTSLSNSRSQLELEKSKLEEKLEKLANSTCELGLENSKLEDQFQKINNEHELLKAEHEKLEIQFRELTEEKKSISNSGWQLEVEKSKLEEKLGKLTNSTSQLKLENSQLDAKLQQITNEYKLFKDEHVKLVIQFRELTEEKKSFLELKSLFNEEKTTLQKQLKCLKEKAEEQSKQIVKEKSELQQQLEEKDKVTQEQQQDLQLQKDNLSKTLVEKQQQFIDLEKNYKIAKQQNLELQNELHTLKDFLTKYNEDKHKKMNEIKEPQNDLPALKESLNKLNEEKQKLEEKLLYYQNLQEDKNKLEATIHTIKSAHSSAVNTFQKERDSLQLTLKQYEQENKQFREKEETLNHKFDKLSQQLHEARSNASNYKKLLQEHEEVEQALNTTTATNVKLQQQVSDLSSQQQQYELTIENQTLQMNNLHLELSKHKAEEQKLHMQLNHLKETLESEKSALQQEQRDLKSSLGELSIKCDSLLINKNQLQNLNQQLEQQLMEATEKLNKSKLLQDEVNTLTAQNIELQNKMEATVAEAGRCSRSLREDLAHHKQLLEKQLESYNTLRIEMEKLTEQKQSLEEKIREITVRNFEQDLQRQAMDAAANASMDSNTSFSPKGRRSLDRLGVGAGVEMKAANISIEEKLSAAQQKISTTTERKNRRLSTHDERRRQSYWGASHDKGTMTDPVDTNCNCIELDAKLKECERNLFIKSSQVTALSMELKNHPLKEENALLMKRLQEEQDKNRIEIKRYKQKLVAQTAKAEKAEKSAHAATTAAAAAEEASSSNIPRVMANAEVQTESELNTCIQQLQAKYNDLKHICRYRYTVIKDLEEKVSQKENSDGNSLSHLDEAKFKLVNTQNESLKSELNTIKEKYEHAKKVLASRRAEIEKLRAELGEAKQ